MEKKLFYEDVTERIAGIVTASTVRQATAYEIAEAFRLHNLGKCPHTIVYDEPGFMYDFRKCYTCGQSLGTV